ncbi:hypothetical protein M9H77_15664 [Catharanthus roseus]|uniref:Uncharacterized protein n=1 Tax=Catharanthus roseus TaxID=4058 RepID=A0ACC0AYX9_CATRO|nr:hypothetical protein M9H77_15664 [Catharanthus roseus]
MSRNVSLALLLIDKVSVYLYLNILEHSINNVTSLQTSFQLISNVLQLNLGHFSIKQLIRLSCFSPKVLSWNAGYLYFSYLYKLLLIGVRNATQRKLCPGTLGHMLYKAPFDGKWGEHEVDYLLFIVRDVDPTSNLDEVANINYVTRDDLKELLRKVDAGKESLKLSLWFRLVVDNFLLNWWDHVEKGNLNEAADMKTIHKLS